MGKGDWVSNSPSNPCPVCGKDSNCKISPDGKAVYCGRVESNRKQNKGGQWLHFLDDGQNTYRSKPIVAPSPKVEKKSTGKGKFKSFPRYVRESKVHPRWVKHYCVPQEIWKRLGCYGDEQALCTPEHHPECFDAVCGVFVRKHGNRFSVTGSTRGVTMSRIPDRNSTATLLVEGASDTGSALAAGLDVIGRHGKGQCLKELLPWLKNVGEAPIVLVVERDHPDDPEKQAAIFNAECVRAQELANLLLRPIIVSSPPEGSKDFNEWWKQATKNQGHRLSERDRHSKGKSMLKYLVESGKDVPPEFDLIVQLNVKSADELSRRIIHRVNVMRELAYADGVDTDYQREDSCAFYKTFLKQDEHGGHKILSTFLSCKRWKCPTCRERILRPNWRMHLAELFAGYPRSIYRMEASSLSEAKAIKRAVTRLKGQFAVFQFLEGKCAIYASQVPKRIEAQLFDLRRFVFHYELLQESFMDDVGKVDPTAPKPISVSREWKIPARAKKGYKPTRSPSSPNQARHLAEQLKLKTQDFALEATGAVQDGVTIEVPNTEDGKQQLSLLKAGLFIA